MPCHGPGRTWSGRLYRPALAGASAWMSSDLVERMAPDPRRTVHPAATRCEMTWIVMPGECNALDTVFGGQVMAWIDVCAAVAAQRFTRGTVVTAAMDSLSFRAPIRRGQIAVLQAQVNWAGKTSAEVGVRVEREDPNTGLRTHTSTAYLTFVALDDSGQPRLVPTLAPTSEDERRRFADGARRRNRRLAQRNEDAARR